MANAILNFHFDFLTPSLILALGGGAPRADLHVKPPSTMGHESLIRRKPSLSHAGWLKYFFSDIQSITLNYHTPRRTHSLRFNGFLYKKAKKIFGPLHILHISLDFVLRKRNLNGKAHTSK